MARYLVAGYVVWVLIGMVPDATRQTYAGEIVFRSPWLQEPLRNGEMSSKDRRARESLAKLIEEKQDDDYRKNVAVIVPEEPAGLPDDYDVLIYGETAGILRLRLEVCVRGSHASGEMVTADGFFRGPLSVRRIDDLVRQMAYACQCEQKRKTGELVPPSVSGYACPERSERIEVISRDDKKPFHLRTESWQPIHDRIGMGTDLLGFAHTVVGNAIEQLVRDNLHLSKPSDDLARELVARLKRIETPQGASSVKRPPTDTAKAPLTKQDGNPPETLALDDYKRSDLESIEAKLYSRLAVDWRLKEAMPELRRLGLSGAVTRLSIAIADEPIGLLKSALVGQDWGIFQWSLDFAMTLPRDKRHEAILYALPRADNSYYVSDILERLSTCDLNASQLAQIGKFYADTKDLRSQIAAAKLLLMKTNQQRYYDFLFQIASKPKKYDDTNVYDPEREAISATLDYGLANHRKRKEVASLIRTLLTRIPMNAPDYSGMRELVSKLGALGEPSDLPLLTRYCEHEDASMVVTAVEAIARLNPDLALEKAHGQIDNYLKGKGREPSFRWYVASYLDLIVWRDDLSAIEILEQALAKYRKEEPQESSWGPVADIVLRYLKAKNVEERLQYALEYAKRAEVSDEWMKEVGQRLVHQGAEPIRCKPLLEPARDRSLKGRSREARPW